jgi:hypothetical protein
MESNIRYHLKACQTSLEKITNKLKMENENISTKIQKERIDKKIKRNSKCLDTMCAAKTFMAITIS